MYLIRYNTFRRTTVWPAGGQFPTREAAFNALRKAYRDDPQYDVGCVFSMAFGLKTIVNTYTAAFMAEMEINDECNA